MMDQSLVGPIVESGLILFLNYWTADILMIHGAPTTQMLLFIIFLCSFRTTALILDCLPLMGVKGRPYKLEAWCFDFSKLKMPLLIFGQVVILGWVRMDYNQSFMLHEGCV